MTENNKPILELLRKAFTTDGASGRRLNAVDRSVGVTPPRPALVTFTRTPPKREACSRR